MTEFIVGDRVVCIHNHMFTEFLTKGKVYIISEIMGRYGHKTLGLEGLDDYITPKATRFLLEKDHKGIKYTIWD